MYDICIITTVHNDFDNRIYHRQLNAVADAGLSVCMVAPWNFQKRSRTDFDFVQTTMPKTRPARVMHGIRTFLAARKVDAKVYIFHDPDFILFGWLLHKLERRPVVYDCHENMPEQILYGKDWIPQFLRQITAVLFRMFENAVVRDLKETIVVVPNLKRRFEHLSARSQLVRNFPGFKIPEHFTHEKAALYTGELSTDYGLEEFVGLARVLKRRGIDIPIRVVDRFQNYEHLRGWFVDTIRDENLNIELLKPVIAEEMPKILARGCVGLNLRRDLPQHTHAYPTKVFEYFAFGLAVLSTDVAGSREILEDGRLGILVPHNDLEVMADALVSLMTDEVLAKSYTDAARKAVVEKYNWPREAELMIGYIRSLLDKRA